MNDRYYNGDEEGEDGQVTEGDNDNNNHTFMFYPSSLKIHTSRTVSRIHRTLSRIFKCVTTSRRKHKIMGFIFTQDALMN